MKHFQTAVLAASVALLLAPASYAQKLVDPDKVAPEYREAAMKRRAEQVKVMECTHKADEAKVLPRDRTAHIQQCIEDKGE
jgi:hypothetical protein